MNQKNYRIDETKGIPLKTAVGTYNMQVRIAVLV